MVTSYWQKKYFRIAQLDYSLTVQGFEKHFKTPSFQNICRIGDFVDSPSPLTVPKSVTEENIQIYLP